MLDEQFILETANVALKQIFAGVGRNVVFSWGPENFRACVKNGCPALSFEVHGLVYSGRVYVCYDLGPDTYTILAGDTKISDVYCDELGNILDGIIERAPGWTDEEYNKRLRAVGIFAAR